MKFSVRRKFESEQFLCGTEFEFLLAADAGTAADDDPLADKSATRTRPAYSLNNTTCSEVRLAVST